MLNKMSKQIISEEFKRIQKLAGLITENFSNDEIQSLASNLDTELKFSPETLKGRFKDLGIGFTLSPDRNQLILNISPSTGYDDAQEFVDTIQSEIGFPEYNFRVEGKEVYITKINK